MQKWEYATQRDKPMKEPRAAIFVRRGLGGSCDRRETVDVSEGRRTNELALLGIEAARPAMDAILLIADADVAPPE